jgi:hypothetical protein
MGWSTIEEEEIQNLIPQNNLGICTNIIIIIN